MWWICAVVAAAVWTLNEGLRLYPCDAGYQEVEEDTPVIFYCDQYPGTGAWRLKSDSTSNHRIPISDCTSTNCSDSQYSDFNVTFISGTNSSLTSPLTDRNQYYFDDQYECYDPSSQNLSSRSLECGLHIIASAVVSQPTTVIIRQDSGYNVSVTANITRAFSSRGLYSCLLQLGSVNQSSAPDLEPPAGDISNTTNRSGSCEVNMRLPNSSGIYPCNIIVTPGNTQKSCDSINITRPSPPTINCPSDVIAENTPITCTCSTNNIGRPGGRLRWYTGTGNDISTPNISGVYDTTTLTMRRMLTRDDHKAMRKFRCVNSWIENINAESDYIANVAWGPDSVSIQGDIPFYTDIMGSLTLTLTCQPKEVNPFSALNYNWNIECDNPNQSNCSFKPRLPSNGNNGDVNKTITCTVINTKNNNSVQQGSVTLNLKYPPRSPPQISGYTANQVLYEGDNLTLTCNVNGGEPQVKNVSLTCPGKYDQSPMNGQTSTLVILPLNASDHNITCACSGQWEKEDYYNLTESRTLTVYYPPSSPKVELIDGQTWPPVEGDTVNLTCSLTSLGFPSAKLMWSSKGRNINANHLSLSVDRGDNQKMVTCQAINNFTQHRETELKDSFKLQVYYGPDINLHSADNNMCDMTSKRTSCNVTEGQRVHLLCNATSNPPAQNCVWQALSGSGSNSNFGPKLDIESVNRTDSGVYQVQVETTNPNSDVRLPLKAHSNLTVLVKYHPTDLKLMVNDKVNTTVNESEAVTLECQSHGRPTPRLELLQRDVELAREVGDKLSLSEEKSLLSHNITARCNNTGTVTCRIDNGVESMQQISVQLYVNCKPRITTPDPGIPKVNFVSSLVSIVFYMEAFPLPLPDKNSFQYLGSTKNSGSRQPVPSSIDLKATCTNTYADFAVQCNISVTDVKDSTAEGFYMFTAANQHGDLSFKFQVTVNATSGTGDKINAVAIGAGIAAGLVVIAVVCLVVWFIRRRRKKQKNKPRNGHSAPEERPEMIMNDLYETSPTSPTAADHDQATMIVNDTYESSGNVDQATMIVNDTYESSGNVDQKTMIVNDFYESSGNVAPRSTINGGPSGNAYEEVSLDARGNHITSPEPQAVPLRSDAENVYSMVKKPKKPLPADAASAEVSNLYAVVDKTKKPPPIPPPPAEPELPKATRPKPGLKPKPDVKNKPYKAKSKGGGGLTEGMEHSNAEPPPGSPEQAEGGMVYENYAFQDDDADPSAGDAATIPEVAGRGDGSSTISADGLLYTTVAFTDSQRQKEKGPDPNREQTDYAGLDFSKMAAEAKTES